MKIGTLTFHFAHNYGAMLQAYALVKKLIMMGYDAKIIDYRLPYIYNNHEKFSFLRFVNFYEQCGNSKIVAFLKAIKNWRKNLSKTPKWYRFEDFLNNTLPKTERLFNIESINNLGLDVVICGSDQIWNDTLTGSLVPLYFGDGLNRSIKKISYAASNGHNFIPDKCWDAFVKYESNLSACSVREEGLSKFLLCRGIANIQVLDPIFLLDREEWNKIAMQPKEKDYVLTYSFDESPDFFNTAEAIARRLKKKLIVFCFGKKNLPENIQQYYIGGPKEFLGYFNNASFVVTNSFHGTAFSILYKKQFVCMPPRLRPERLESVLDLFHLNDRMLKAGDKIKHLSDIDFVRVDRILAEKRQLASNYLLKNLTINNF